MKFVKKLKDESGQAMILTLLCMTCLLGFVGFAADIGTLLRAKRNLQIAADSAAIAGAAELNYGNMTAAAQAAAGQNGVTIGTNGGAVVVNTPPTYGAYAGLPGYVEAIVTQTQPTFFMRIFNFTSQNVTARAVAWNGGSSNGCVYVCDKQAAGAMTLQGSFDVTAPKCGIIVDSNNADALQFTGGGGTLTAGSVGVVGGDGGQTGDSTPAPVTNIAPVSCPLAGLAFPDPTTMTCTVPTGGNLTGPLTAGCYSAPAGKKGALGTLNISNATLGAGTYVLEGNVNLSGNITSGSGGTTLDIYNGALTEGTAATNLNLVAPAPGTGAYGGIAIMQPPTNTNTLTFEFGNSTGTIDGILYAPTAQLFLHDSGGDKSGGITLITDLIVGTLNDQTADLSITNYSTTVGTSPLTKIALVE
ncbi:MAG: pilus assembly protein TadG-related protein [Acidobacteriota bacterium]